MARKVSSDSTSENIQLRIIFDQENDDCTNKTIQKASCISNCCEKSRKEPSSISGDCRNPVSCFCRNQDGDCNRCDVTCDSCIASRPGSVMDCVGPPSTGQGMCQYGSSCCTGSAVESCASVQPCSACDQQAEPVCSCSNNVAASSDCCNSLESSSECSNTSNSSPARCNSLTANTDCCTNVEANIEETSCCQLNQCIMLAPPATRDVTCNCSSISHVCGDVKLPSCVHQQAVKRGCTSSNSACQTCDTLTGRVPCCCFRGDNLSETSSNNIHTILLTGAQTNTTVQGTITPCCCCSNCIVIPLPLSRKTTISNEDKDNINTSRQSLSSRNSSDMDRSRQSMDDYDLSGIDETEPLSSAKRKSKMKRRTSKFTDDEGENSFEGPLPYRTRSSYLLKRRKSDMDKDENKDVYDKVGPAKTRRSILKHKSDGLIGEEENEEVEEDEGEEYDSFNDDGEDDNECRARSCASRHRKSEQLSDEDGRLFDDPRLTRKRSSQLKQKICGMGTNEDDNAYDDPVPSRRRSSINRRSKNKIIADEDMHICGGLSPTITSSSLISQRINSLNPNEYGDSVDEFGPAMDINSNLKRRSSGFTTEEEKASYKETFPSRSRSTVSKQRKGDISSDEKEDDFDHNEPSRRRSSLMKQRQSRRYEEIDEYDFGGNLPRSTRSSLSRQRKSTVNTDEEGNLVDSRPPSRIISSVLIPKKGNISAHKDDSDSSFPSTKRSSLNRQRKDDRSTDKNQHVFDSPSRRQSSVSKQRQSVRSYHDNDGYNNTFPTGARPSLSKRSKSNVSSDEDGNVFESPSRRQSSISKQRQSMRSSHDNDGYNNTFPTSSRSSLNRQRKSDVNSDEEGNLVGGRVPSRVRSSLLIPRKSEVSAHEDAIDGTFSRQRKSDASTDEEVKVLPRRRSSLSKQSQSAKSSHENDGYNTFATGSKSSLNKQRKSEVSSDEEGNVLNDPPPTRRRSSLLKQRKSEISTNDDNICNSLPAKTRSSLSRQRNSDVSIDKAGNGINSRTSSRRRSSLLRQSSSTSIHEAENDASYLSRTRSSLSKPNNTDSIIEEDANLFDGNAQPTMRRSILKRKTQEFPTDEDENRCYEPVSCRKRSSLSGQCGSYSDEDDNDETFISEFHEEDDMFEVPVPCRRGSSSQKHRSSEELTDEYGSIFDGDIPSTTGFRRDSRLSTDEVDNITYDPVPSSDSSSNTLDTPESSRRRSILKQKTNDDCECSSGETSFDSTDLSSRSPSNTSIREGRRKLSCRDDVDEPYNVDNSYSSQEDDSLNDYHVNFVRNLRDSSKKNSENDTREGRSSMSSNSKTIHSDEEPWRKQQTRPHGNSNVDEKEEDIAVLDEIIDPGWSTGLKDKSSYFVIKSSNDNIYTAIPIENTPHNNNKRPVSSNSIADNEYYESDKEDRLEKKYSKRNFLSSGTKSVIRDSNRPTKKIVKEISNTIPDLRYVDDKADESRMEKLKRKFRIPRNNSRLRMETSPNNMKSQRWSGVRENSFQDNEYNMLRKHSHESVQENKIHPKYIRSRKGSPVLEGKGRESVTSDCSKRSMLKRINIPFQADSPKRHLRVSFVDVSPTRSGSELRQPNDDLERVDQRELMLREIGARTFREPSSRGVNNISGAQNTPNISEVEEEVRDTVFYLTNINNTGNPFLSNLPDEKLMSSRKRSH